MSNFEAIWNRIQSHHAEIFTQIRGGEFTYEISGDYVIPDRTNQSLPKSHFKEAFGQVPLENTAPVQHLRGPSYIYAIMMDPRIRQSDW